MTFKICVVSPIQWTFSTKFKFELCAFQRKTFFPSTGFADPTKDLRKAVKQKEKAAKKARKAKKKQGGKKEDLFDPENLAKYKVIICKSHNGKTRLI